MSPSNKRFTSAEIRRLYGVTRRDLFAAHVVEQAWRPAYRLLLPWARRHMRRVAQGEDEG